MSISLRLPGGLEALDFGEHLLIHPPHQHFSADSLYCGMLAIMFEITSAFSRS